MITITVETDEEQRLVQSPALFGGGAPEPAVVQMRVVRDGQVITAGGVSVGMGGGGGGSGVPVKPRHPAYETSHVLTIADGGAVLHHPPSGCAGRSPDCPFQRALSAMTAEQRTMNGKWTCEVRDRALMLLERIGD